ncbi:MAG: hypothetical protein ED557_09870 [Balneola sp.]|nr:MAG: hypothetical protein ED557_09870 [Balneola sp.]
MGWFKNKKKGVPPHTWYPEILHWQEGDKINCWNIAQAIAVGWKFDWGTFRKYSNADNAHGQYIFTYKSVDEHGKIYLTDDDEHIVEFHFFRFIKYARNESLKSRNMLSKVNNSQEYMELMKNFQQAFNELQEGDNHPKRLGPESDTESKSS